MNSNYKNPQAPPGSAWCSFCRCYKARDLFYRNRATSNGLQSVCKDCTKQAVCGIRRRRYEIHLQTAVGG